MFLIAGKSIHIRAIKGPPRFAYPVNTGTASGFAVRMQGGGVSSDSGYYVTAYEASATHTEIVTETVELNDVAVGSV